MYIHTKAVVISSTKYSESSLIVKCITAYGVQSYLLKGILKAKKKIFSAAHFQVFSQIEITASHREKGTLEYIKECSILYPYKSVYYNPVKQIILFYLSEFLSKVLQEHLSNSESKDILNYIINALQWLDTHEGVANFHLLFMVDLTHHLGVYPNKKEIKNAPYFDLKEGEFVYTQPIESISGDELKNFKALLNSSLDTIHDLNLNSNKRNSLLDCLIKYYKIHLEGFISPKSSRFLHELL